MRVDPAALAFHAAASAGPAALAEWVAAARPWWAPVLDGGFDPGWRAIFESSAAFRGWVARHGPPHPALPPAVDSGEDSPPAA